MGKKLIHFAPKRPGVVNMDMIMGMVIWFAGSFAPSGYLEANGQCFPIQYNTALFSIIGYKYGGEVNSNFCLPDLRPMTNGTRDPNWNNGPRALIVVEGIYPSRP